MHVCMIDINWGSESMQPMDAWVKITFIEKTDQEKGEGNNDVKRKADWRNV